jgi:hypothetical protein
MEVKFICKICKNDDFIDFFLGIENKPKHFLKCTKCLKEYAYTELTPECEGENCKI